MKIATRRAWRRAWNLWGPLLPLALAAALILGSALAWRARSEPYAATVTWSDGTTEEVCVPLGRQLCEDPRWVLYLKPRNPRSGARVTRVGPCVPKACVEPRENCIVGYVGPRAEGYCR